MFTHRSFQKNQIKNADCQLNFAGRQACPPSHFFGPAIRDHYLIHYILSGKGKFKKDCCEYDLHKGQGFLICPNELAFYKADDVDPWEYVWIGFSGHNCQNHMNQCGLSEANPIFSFDNIDISIDTVAENLIKICELDPLSAKFNYSALGYLYLFFAELANQNRPLHKTGKGEEIILKAIEYIELNYFKNFTVLDLCDSLYVDRTYLFKLFKKYMNQSPSNFLSDYRLEKACTHLNNTNLKISIIAQISGYSDTAHFWRVFKKKYGVSPLEYRKFNSLTSK